MKVVLQISKDASVTIDNKVVGKIDYGYTLLVGFTFGDTEEIVRKVADKLLALRVFPDQNGKTNLSLKDVNGEILSISQFTLYANTNEGRRPSFVNALKPDEATKLYDYFNIYIEQQGYKVEKGIFGADMKVKLINDGPFTIILDSKDMK